jgi:hypothetical protein
MYFWYNLFIENFGFDQKMFGNPGVWAGGVAINRR